MEGRVGLVGWRMHSSRQFTHKVGHLSTIDRAQGRESLRTKTDVLTTEPYRHSLLPQWLHCVLGALNSFSAIPWRIFNTNITANKLLNLVTIFILNTGDTEICQNCQNVSVKLPCNIKRNTQHVQATERRLVTEHTVAVNIYKSTFSGCIFFTSQECRFFTKTHSKIKWNCSETPKRFSSIFLRPRKHGIFKELTKKKPHCTGTSGTMINHGHTKRSMGDVGGGSSNPHCTKVFFSICTTVHA